LKTVTMQNVACATTTVKRPSSIPKTVRNMLLSAMPVTMPGSAIGRMMKSETTLRPKNLLRVSARAAIVPSTSETTVASSPTWTLTRSACRAPAECQARLHHSVV
jgi:hypothetical protein